MGCPYCYGCFDYWDDYCYYWCPYSLECEDEYYGYYYDNYYFDSFYKESETILDYFEDDAINNSNIFERSSILFSTSMRHDMCKHFIDASHAKNSNILVHLP